MSLRIYDSTLEHRTTCRLQAMLAAEACNKALAAGVAARMVGNFENAEQLRDANSYLAMAGVLYATVAFQEPDEIIIHPALERQMKQAGENEIPL